MTSGEKAAVKCHSTGDDSWRLIETALSLAYLEAGWLLEHSPSFLTPTKTADLSGALSAIS